MKADNIEKLSRDLQVPASTLRRGRDGYNIGKATRDVLDDHYKERIAAASKIPATPKIDRVELVTQGAAAWAGAMLAKGDEREAFWQRFERIEAQLAEGEV